MTGEGESPVDKQRDFESRIAHENGWVHNLIECTHPDCANYTANPNDKEHEMTIQIPSEHEKSVHDMIADQAWQNRIKAHQKHGDNSIESKRYDDSLFWLACIGEEVGEATDEVLALVLASRLGSLASTFTYDKDRSKLFGEILDVLTVGFAWASNIYRNDPDAE